MGERINSLEKDLTFQEPLGDMKEIRWANIFDSINDVWHSIQVIFLQTKLVKVTTEAVHKTREELGDMPEVANLLITFLKNRNRYQLDELEIDDRIETII